MTDRALLAEDALARGQVGGARRCLERGWFVHLSTPFTECGVEIPERGDIRHHCQHFGAVAWQFAPVHAARHAPVDAVHEIAHTAVAAGETRVRGRRLQQ
jgi:hypothetical protein